MSKVNPKLKPAPKTLKSTRLAGGGGMLAARQGAEALLRRAVMACLLWEDLAYESGTSNSDNIAALIPQVSPEMVYSIAIEARLVQKLRHVPLFIASEMAQYREHNALLASLLPQIITRADQISDFLAIYWKKGKKPLTRQMKKGLAESFNNFNEYQFAKYDREGAIKLRDVMFLVHPKPIVEDQKELFKKIADRTLTIPDTWEVELSQSQDKRASWTRLIQEGKLGGMAFLRNLRNFKDTGVDHNIVRNGFKNLKTGMLLPLNFYAAYKNAPEFAAEIEKLMIDSYSDLPKLPGYSQFVVDLSGSMSSKVSDKSTYNRYEVAAVMAMFASFQCEEVDIYLTAGSDSRQTHQTKKLQYPKKGFGLVEQILAEVHGMGGGGIFTAQCLDYMKKDTNREVDRIAIFSDSQDCDHSGRIPAPYGKNNYIVDVSAHKHGVNYKGVWTAEISGWSEHFLTFIAAYEGVENTLEEV